MFLNPINILTNVPISNKYEWRSAGSKFLIRNLNLRRQDTNVNNKISVAI